MSLLLGALVAAQLRAKQADAWTLDVLYPRFSAGGPASRKANAASKARERRAFDEFLAKARREVPGLRGQVTRARYELKVTPHRITDRTGLASGYVERYDYLAGAHGTTRYDALNFGSEGELGLADLFTDPRSATMAASEGLLAVMKAMKAPPSKVASGEWTRLTEAQADRFVVGTSGILFLFDQYELGVGAEGAPKVLVPWSRLPGTDRKGVLRAIFGGRR